MSLIVALHVLAAVIWVGGMFFAYMVLRPEAAAQLQPPLRLTLWSGCFGRFFPWVWGAVILLPTTGYYLIFAGFGGMATTPIHVHVMNGIGLVMIALFIFLFFGPYAHLKRAVTAQDWPTGGARLATIRRIVGANLLLGLVTTVVAAGGRYFSI
jgi:uncharacterized membrane protein